jgi:hypothetical protein
VASAYLDAMPLYLADSQTQNPYRTSSIKMQIEQNDLVPGATR